MKAGFKLQQMKNGNFVLNIPRQLVAAKGWKKGTVISFKLDNKGCIVMKEVNVDTEGTPAPSSANA